MYRFMDKEEIEIRQLKNLKMLHLYQLGGSDAIAAYYGENKQINLCAMDKNYNLLMERILTLYAACEDKSSIIIDENSKAHIEQAIQRGTGYTSFFNKIGSRYRNMECQYMPKFSSDGVIRETLLPLVCYYVKQLYGLWEIDCHMESMNRGWNRNCVLSIKAEKEDKRLPIRMEFPDANGCTIKIGNFISDMNILNLSVSYSDNCQLIIFECRELGLAGQEIISLDNKGVKTTTSISLGGQTVYYMDNALKELQVDENNILELLELSADGTRLYRLPWGSYIVSKQVENNDKNWKNITVDTVYIEKKDTKYCIRHFSYGLVENLSDGLKLRTDGAVMRKLYYGDKHRELETLFMPVGYYSGWDYKEFLENRYFYEIVEEAK